MRQLKFSCLPLYALFFLVLFFSNCKKNADLTPPCCINPLTASNIPSVYINTNGGTIIDDPKIPATLDIKYGDSLDFSHRIGIELRGSTSQMLFDQKSFGLELWDPTGSGVGGTPLAFPKETDFILYAVANDKSLLRNVLIYELSNAIGMYAVRTQYVNLYLNGNYNGLYVFMEKIKRDVNRVNITKMLATDNSGTNVSGGYILKIDKSAGDNTIGGWAGDATYTSNMSWRSNYDQSGNLLLTAPYGTKTGKETYFIYNYPKSDVITSEQKKYISKYVDDFEKALLSANFKDPSVGYAAYIDEPSFIDFMLLNEFSHNPDGYRLSTFLHKDRGAKLKMGPIWDFNIAFGNHDNGNLAATNNWIYDFNSYVPGDTWLIHFWWKRLLQDPAFTAQAKARWASIRADKFSNENMNAIIDKHVGYLQKYNAINKHFAKWQVLGVKMPFNGYVGQTYNDELTFFRNWINARLAWMDAQIKLL